jgi:hypothetical protein
VSRKIHKHVLTVTDEQDVALPKGAMILSVAEQNGKLCMWYGFDEDVTEAERRRIFVIGTGNPVPDVPLGEFLGTVLSMGGRLVWHIFALEGVPIPSQV